MAFRHIKRHPIRFIMEETQIKTLIPCLAHQNGKSLIDWQHIIGKAEGNKHSQSISTAYTNAK